MANSVADRLRSVGPALLGYSHLERVLGCHRRTIQRMVERGEFPKPMPIAKGTVGFALEDVLAWYDRKRAALEAIAVSDPAKLSTDNAISALQDIAARLATEANGQQVLPEQITGFTRELSAAEHAQALAEMQERSIQEMADQFAAFRSLFTGLDQQATVAVVNWLFPAMRRIWSADAAARGQYWPASDADAEAQAIAAMVLAWGSGGDASAA